MVQRDLTIGFPATDADGKPCTVRLFFFFAGQSFQPHRGVLKEPALLFCVLWEKQYKIAQQDYLGFCEFSDEQRAKKKKIQTRVKTD